MILSIALLMILSIINCLARTPNGMPAGMALKASTATTTMEVNFFSWKNSAHVNCASVHVCVFAYLLWMLLCVCGVRVGAYGCGYGVKKLCFFSTFG